MKKTLIYMAALAIGAATLASCDNDFEKATLESYEEANITTMVANTTILELKQKFYKDGFTDYATLIPEKETPVLDENGEQVMEEIPVLDEEGNPVMDEEGNPVVEKQPVILREHYIIEGVISSNIESGNIYNQVFLQDETAGLQISISSKYLDSNGYRDGQKVVVDVTGMYIGAYGKGMQIGAIAPDDKEYPGRLTDDDWKASSARVGLRFDNEVAPTDVTIDELEAMIPGAPGMESTDNWLKYQGMLVRLKDVTFKTPGEPLGSHNVSNNTQNFVGASKVCLNTSGYSKIYNYLCPEGTGDIVGILTWFTNSSGSTNTWQLKLIDLNGLEGFTPVEEPDAKPEIPRGDGTLAHPYNPSQVITLIQSGAYPTSDVYVKGYVFGNPQIDLSYGNATYYISDNGQSTNKLYVYRGKSLNGNKFTSTDELKQGDCVIIRGQLTTYNSNPQINTGSAIMSINGDGDVTPDTPDVPAQPAIPEGNGTVDSPFNASQANAVIKSGDFDANTKYVVKGYVSSIKEINLEKYHSATFYISNDGTKSDEFYVYGCKYLEGADFTSEDQLKVGDLVVVQGNLINYKDNTPEMTAGGTILSLDRAE